MDNKKVCSVWIARQKLTSILIPFSLIKPYQTPMFILYLRVSTMHHEQIFLYVITIHLLRTTACHALRVS